MQRVINIDTNVIALKNKYDIDKSNLENKINDGNNKIPNICERVKKTDYNAKITEIEPSNNGLVTTAALTIVRNKTLDVSNIFKKTNYDTKVSDIESEYSTAADYNKFTRDIFADKIKSGGLVDKSAISGFISNAGLDRKN